MLLGNYNIINANSGRAIGGVTDPTLRLKAGVLMNWYLADTPDRAALNRSGIPQGTQPPYSLLWGRTGGGLSSTANEGGYGDATGNLWSVRSLTGTADGVGSATGNAGLLIQLAGELAGIGAASGTLRGLIQLAGELMGVGSATGALGALVGLVGTAAGVGSTTADLKGLLSLSGTVSPFTELSPENLAASVWSALAASYNVAGTMGAKLNAASSAGDPWSTALPGAYAVGTAGWLVAMLAKFARNKIVTDPVAGTLTVYEDDGTTVLLSGQLWQDAAGTVQYAGSGSDRRDRLT